MMNPPWGAAVRYCQKIAFLPYCTCRGDHWSPADACGNGKPSGRIWNPPLQSPLGPLCEGDSPQCGEMSRQRQRGPGPKGSARRRWGRELYGCPKYFGLWQGSLPPPLRGTAPPLAQAPPPPYRESLSRRGRFYFFQSNVGMGLDPSAPLAAVG